MPAALKLHVLSAVDHLDMLGQGQRQIEVQVLSVTADFLDEHDEHTVDPVRATLPGRQRAVTLGGEGTPKVAEFAPALITGRLELSPWAAARLCADVLDLRHRLPAIWAEILSFRARAGHARTSLSAPATSVPSRRRRSICEWSSRATEGSRGGGSPRWSRPRSWPSTLRLLPPESRRHSPSRWSSPTPPPSTACAAST